MVPWAVADPHKAMEGLADGQYKRGCVMHVTYDCVAAAGCAFTSQHQISDWAAHPASDGNIHHHGGSVGWGFLK